MDNTIIKNNTSSVSPHATDTTTAGAPPKSEVDDFLRRKRKVREHKACYPCRQRKVRCDLGRPCRTCVEREHPELCDYHPPTKKQNIGSGGGVGNNSSGNSNVDPRFEDQQLGGGGGSFNGGNSVTLAQSDFHQLCRKLESVEQSLEDLRREIRNNGTGGNGNVGVDFHRLPQFSGASSPAPHSNSGGGNGNGRSEAPRFFENSFTRHASLHGIHTRNDLTGQTVHLGGSSVPALVMALGQGNREQSSIQEILGKSMLPIFGLDNETATYPFVDLWGLAHGSLAKAEQLAKTIPTDSQCLSFFQCYRDMGHVIYPGVADCAAMETDLTSFLMTRANYREMEGELAGEVMPGVTETSIYDRDLHWLGMLFAVLASGCQCSGLPRKERELTSQVYVCCSFECLRFTNYLSHATLESVQTLLILGNVISNNMNAGTAWNLLGLTVRLAQSLGLHQACPSPVPPEIKALRSKIWWSLMWQDSLLSITYDRASSTALMDHSQLAVPFSETPLPPFHVSMYRVCKVGLDVVRDRSRAMSGRDLRNRITKHRDEIDTVMKESAEYLRDSRRCRTLRDSVEHWALYLHTSYITSELCRPAISPSTADPELAKQFKQLCLDSLVNTVEAFLGLQNITTYARQSWASVHRALSSALLLGIMGEYNHNERCRKLLGRFVALMGDISRSVEPQELAAPMERAITALRKLNIDGSDMNGLHPLVQQPMATNNRDAGTGTTNATLMTGAGSGQSTMIVPPRFIEDIALGGTGSSTSRSSNSNTTTTSITSPRSAPGSGYSNTAGSMRSIGGQQQQHQHQHQQQQQQQQQQRQQQQGQPHNNQNLNSHTQSQQRQTQQEQKYNPQSQGQSQSQSQSQSLHQQRQGQGQSHCQDGKNHPDQRVSALGYQPSVPNNVAGYEDHHNNDEEESPYSVLNSILWGNGHTP